MGRTATVLEVLIASPSDVTAARDAITAAIHAWNGTHSEREGVILQPLRWELDARPELGDRPQAVINRQIVDRADITIAVFWTRLGTPTGHAASGTAEEIQRSFDAGRPTLLYFPTKRCRRGVWHLLSINGCDCSKRRFSRMGCLATTGRFLTSRAE